MHTFETARVTLAYRDEGAGSAIVFLHNGGTSSSIWRNQVEALAPTHRVIAIDLPGFGASPLPDPPVTLPEMVEAIAALIVELRIEPVRLVGNCMGSNISVLLSRSHPDLVEGVLAINPLTAASFSGGGLGLTHRMRRLGKAPTRLFRGVSRKLPIPKFVAPLTLRFQLGSKGVARGLQHDEALVACQLRADQMPALIDVLDDMDAYGRLDTAEVQDTVPIWVVWGAQNRVLSREAAADLADHLHAGRVEVIEGTGHLPMLEDPEAVTGLIEAFSAVDTQPTKAS